MRSVPFAIALSALLASAAVSCLVAACRSADDRVSRPATDRLTGLGAPELPEPSGVVGAADEPRRADEGSGGQTSEPAMSGPADGAALDEGSGVGAARADQPTPPTVGDGRGGPNDRADSAGSPVLEGAGGEAEASETPAAAPCLPEPPAGMACVPGGWFVRGRPRDQGHSCEQPDQPRDGRPADVPAAHVWVETFYMDVYEVTNAAYEACVEAGDCPEAGPLYMDFDRPRQPITAVSWYDAVTFCEAQGKRLPTEAEWELAARGHDGEIYPWGDAPATCELAVIADERGRSCGVRKRGSHPDAGRVLEVGSRPPGRFGLYDMVGNAEEWVADWWTADYDACGADCQGLDPRGPCAGEAPCPGHRYRVVRGGSWYWPAEHNTGSHRRRYRPANDPPHHFGFRCAATLEEAQRLADVTREYSDPRR